MGFELYMQMPFSSYVYTKQHSFQSAPVTCRFLGLDQLQLRASCHHWCKHLFPLFPVLLDQFTFVLCYFFFFFLYSGCLWQLDIRTFKKIGCSNPMSTLVSPESTPYSYSTGRTIFLPNLFVHGQTCRPTSGQMFIETHKNTGVFLCKSV